MERSEKTLTLRQLQAIDDGLKVAENEDTNRAIPGASQGGRLAGLKSGTSYKFSRIKDLLYSVIINIKKQKQKFKDDTATKKDEKGRTIEWDKFEYDKLEEEFLLTTETIRLPEFNLTEFTGSDGSTLIPMRLFNALFPLIVEEEKEQKK